jgi:hypothetical protein
MSLNMHHPDICNILLIVDDYFLLIDDKNSTCQIKPIVDNSEDDEPKLGIKISRKLLNGYLHTLIWGENQDSDNVIFSYSSELNSNQYLESIEIECSDYCIDSVRNAVRDLLKLDKKSAQQKTSCC